MTTPARPALPARRLTSLDALRGFDLFWILGADSFVYALRRLSPNPVTRFLADQLDHAEWIGFHFYDLIFPLFVFIMGVSTVFSLTKILATEGRTAAVRRVVLRGALLFVVGLIYSGGATHPWPNVRLLGVLNRIALCYTFGGLVFCFVKPRGMIALAGALLLGYWAMLALVPFPDVRPDPATTPVITKQAGFKSVSQLNMASTTRLRGSYVQGVNLTDYVDQKYLPGRKYDGTYDPEGILSTLPAFVTGLLGIFAGLYLRGAPDSGPRKAVMLFGAGAAAVAVGFLWGLEFPVIKKIWTSSYVLVAGGYSAMLLGIFHWVVDVRQPTKWCQPFIWIGMNSIALYLLSGFIGGYDAMATKFVGGSIKLFFDTRIAAGCGDVVVALVGVLLFVGLARLLYRHRVFLRF